MQEWRRQMLAWAKQSGMDLLFFLFFGLYTLEYIWEAASKHLADEVAWPHGHSTSD